MIRKSEDTSTCGYIRARTCRPWAHSEICAGRTGPFSVPQLRLERHAIHVTTEALTTLPGCLFLGRNFAGSRNQGLLARAGPFRVCKNCCNYSSTSMHRTFIITLITPQHQLHTGRSRCRQCDECGLEVS